MPHSKHVCRGSLSMIHKCYSSATWVKTLPTLSNDDFRLPAWPNRLSVIHNLWNRHIVNHPPNDTHLHPWLKCFIAHTFLVDLFRGHIIPGWFSLFSLSVMRFLSHVIDSVSVTCDDKAIFMTSCYLFLLHIREQLLLPVIMVLNKMISYIPFHLFFFFSASLPPYGWKCHKFAVKSS